MRIAGWLACAALFAGCGDDDTADTNQQANQQGPDAAVACDFEAELALRTGANPIDCGSIPRGASVDVLKTAQKCVLDAATAKSAFKLEVAWQGTDSSPSAAFAGNGKTVSILDFDSDPSGGSNIGPSLNSKLCDAYQVTADCEVHNGSLCLECKTQYEASSECVPTRVEGCNGVGNYEVGKEGGYKPCCPGLREVFHQRQEQSDNGPACVDLPLRLSFCIAGRCGDGVCDPLESQACGTCALDCPGK